MKQSLTLALSKGRIFDETLPLLEAAGITVSDDPEQSRKLILPTAQQLTNMKRTAGFESIPDYRLDFKPKWAD